MRTYDPHSLSEIIGGTTKQFLRVRLNIEVGLSVNVLDLVDPWLQLFTFEDRRVASRVQGHD